jgi:hypothetical protein
MNYETSESFSGSPAKAIEFAAAALTTGGFRIEDHSETMLQAKGSGTCNNKNAYYGISLLTLRVSGGILRAEATIDAGKRILRLLGLVLSIVFAATVLVFVVTPMTNHHGQSLPVNQRLLLPLLPFAPWPVLAPVMAMVFRSRARKAVDTLVHNAAAMASQ